MTAHCTHSKGFRGEPSCEIRGETRISEIEFRRFDRSIQDGIGIRFEQINDPGRFQYIHPVFDRGLIFSYLACDISVIDHLSGSCRRRDHKPTEII